MSDSNKITAEWTVHAQLTITRPDGAYTNSSHTIRTNESIGNSENNASASTERFFHEENPIKVIYKWCSDAEKSNSRTDTVVVDSKNTTHSVKNDENNLIRSRNEVHPYELSTTTTPTTSKSSTKSECRSTCNIILSACTDIIPETNELAENFTTTYYTSIPSIEEQSQVNCKLSYYALLTD